VTTISYPCPGCSFDLLFAREEPHGRITARCDRCELVYAMSPNGVQRVEDTATESDHRGRSAGSHRLHPG